jgi:hypothetical protein
VVKEADMTIDPHNAHTWTVLSQSTPAERRLIALLGWITSITHRVAGGRALRGR